MDRDQRPTTGATPAGAKTTGPLARTERAALCDLLDAVGPDAPTLCAGWATRDLAAHLVVRERRLDAAAGIALPLLHAHGDRVRDRYAARPFDEVVALVRAGPPRLSPFGLARIDEAANGVEMLVHHEDVRRAAAGWQPRELPASAHEELWRRIRGPARRAFRPVGGRVVLDGGTGAPLVVGDGPREVTLRGAPAELMLYLFGRGAHALVDLDGDHDLLAVVRALDLSV